MKLIKTEYEYLKNHWQGARGAAYNSVYEFLRHHGYADSSGRPTAKGLDACREYERETLA